MTATDSHFDFDFPTSDPASQAQPDLADDAPIPSRRRRRARTTRRAVLISVIAGGAAAAGSIGLTGSSLVDAAQRFVIVALVTFIGSHAHRWAWFVAGALLAAVVRDLPLLATLLGLAAAVASTRFAHRAKDVGAISVGLMATSVFHAAGHNVGWPTVPATLLAFTLLVCSGFPNMRRKYRRTLGRTLAVLAVVLLATTGAAAFAIARSAGDVSAGASAARNALAAVRQGDTEAAMSHLESASAHLDAADSTLGPFTRPALFVPGIGQQIRAIDTSVAQAKMITGAARTLVDTNYHDLRYEGSINLKQVIRLQAPATSVAEILATADDDLAAVQRTWLLPPLADRVDQFAADVRDARADTDLASQTLDVLPNLLGVNGARRYAVAFITPAELRGGGGFIGSWAELTAANGNVTLTDSGRTIDLISARPAGTRQLNGPEDYVRRYGRFAPQDYLQDVPYSPDWPSNAEVYASLYEQSTGRHVDGVIAVDPTGLAALLELTGPVQVEGLEIPLQASNAVQLLTRQQYLQFADRSEREDVLAAATKATFEELVDASLPAPELIGAALGPAARGRHLQLWSRTEDEQALFKTLNADSALSIPTGTDGFSVVQQNIGNNKLDAYLQRSIGYEVTIDADTGALAGTMTIRLENQNERLDLPVAVVGNNRGAPRGTNVASVSIHAPWQVTSATIDGEATVLGRGDELGLFAWDTPMLQVPPGGEVVVVLQIAGSVDLRDGYHLRILPQPVAQTDVLDARILLDGGRFGDLDGDLGSLDVDASAQELHLTGRMDQVVDVTVSATR